VRGGRKIWELILEAIDLGLVPINDACISTTCLRVLVPGASSRGFCSQFNLLNPRDRMEIRDQLFPIMVARRERILAEPHRIGEIVTEYCNEMHAKAKTEAQEKQRQEAVATLAPGQSELMMFGKTVWPRLDDRQGAYDYDQIRAAIWTFRDLDNWNRQIEKDNGAGSRAIRIRLSTKWYGEYVIRNGRDSPMRAIFGLVHWMSRLMETNPDGQCKWPAYPTSEAEW
jgi:hypothetical protein